MVIDTDHMSERSDGEAAHDRNQALGALPAGLGPQRRPDAGAAPAGERSDARLAAARRARSQRLAAARA